MSFAAAAAAKKALEEVERNESVGPVMETTKKALSSLRIQTEREDSQKEELEQ